MTSTTPIRDQIDSARDELNALLVTLDAMRDDLDPTDERMAELNAAVFKWRNKSREQDVEIRELQDRLTRMSEQIKAVL